MTLFDEALTAANSEGWRVVLTQEPDDRWHAYVRKPGEARFIYLLGSGWGDDPATAIYAALATGYSDEARHDVRDLGGAAPDDLPSLSSLIPRPKFKRRF